MNKKTISSQQDKPLTYLKKTFESRGVAFSLAKSEIKGRTAQTYLKYLINLIQILLGTLLYWLIIGIILEVKTGNIPFPLFVLTGLIPWMYFSGLLQEAGNSVISSRHLITKIYFPRVILPLSKIFPGLIDFFIAVMIVIVLLIIWKKPLCIELLTIPFFLFILVFSSLAIGIWISSFSIKFRDLSRIIPYLVNFGFFMTPVFYPSTIIPPQISFILYVNPVAFAIEGIRWAMFKLELPSIYYLISFIPMIILFVWGWRNYRKNEKHYADVI